MTFPLTEFGSAQFCARTKGPIDSAFFFLVSSARSKSLSVSNGGEVSKISLLITVVFLAGTAILRIKHKAYCLHYLLKCSIV